VSTFTDAKGWYPGIEIRGNRLFYRDPDASTVVPSKGNQPYSTRVVDAAGTPLKQFYGEDIGLATPLGSGNPADDGVAYNTTVQVRKTSAGNQSAQIHVTPPTP
jgi:immune inhibitor A